MPELRQDPTTKEWVVIAIERAKRPDQFREATRTEPSERPVKASCPFFPGSEHLIPDEVFALRGLQGQANSAYRVNVWRSAERLSALALVSKSVGSELGPVSRAIRAAAQTLSEADASRVPACRSEVIESLEAQAVRLEALEADLDERFLDTLESVRAGQKNSEGL